MIGWSIDARGIATITLDRAAVRNAIPVAGWHDLVATIDAIADSEARAVILRSATPNIFSAGADISEFGAFVGAPAAASDFRIIMRTAIGRLASLAMPTIALVEGGCFGAAVALILACDIRIAGPVARFAITPAKLGISYPASDVERLMATVGRSQAARLLFTAAAIDAVEAQRIGLIDQCADNPAATIDAMAAAIAAYSPTAIARLKAVIADPADPAHDAAFDAAFSEPGVAAALAAFQEKRR
jgi:enoyl-CoA hydratase/carnithine racemase